MAGTSTPYRRRTGAVLGTSVRYGMGYGIFERSVGWGASLVMVDLDARMTVSYVMNQTSATTAAWAL